MDGYINEGQALLFQANESSYVGFKFFKRTWQTIPFNFGIKLFLAKENKS